MIRYALLLIAAVCWLEACSSNPPNRQAPPSSVSAKQQAPPSPTDPSLIPPETVRVERIDFAKNAKNITMSNGAGKYILSCDATADSCLSPSPGRDYLLFNKNTKCKLRWSDDYVTLDSVMGWIMPYKGENIAILPADADGDLEQRGIYRLVSWNRNN